jgi:hypothetical protein
LPDRQRILEIETHFLFLIFDIYLLYNKNAKGSSTIKIVGHIHGIILKVGAAWWLLGAIRSH